MRSEGAGRVGGNWGCNDWVVRDVPGKLSVGEECSLLLSKAPR